MFDVHMKMRWRWPFRQTGTSTVLRTPRSFQFCHLRMPHTMPPTNATYNCHIQMPPTNATYMPHTCRIHAAYMPHYQSGCHKIRSASCKYVSAKIGCESKPAHKAKNPGKAGDRIRLKTLESRDSHAGEPNLCMTGGTEDVQAPASPVFNSIICYRTSFVHLLAVTCSPKCFILL